jgi:histidine triad (HIT) family protein
MYDKNNIFAKIINKEISAKIIYEDDKIISFDDINKKALVHVIIVPKSYFISYQDFIVNSNSEEISYFFKTIDKIANILNIQDSYRLITNHGNTMGQVVFHFHIHLMGGGLIS